MPAEVIQDLLTQSAQTHPDRPAVIAPKGQLTYAELDHRSAELASALVAAGVTSGKPVALSIPKSLDSVVAVYGILRAGGCYVPIDPFAPPIHAAKIIHNANVEVLVTCQSRIDAQTRPLADEPLSRSLQQVFVAEAEHYETIGRLSIQPWSGARAELPSCGGSDLAYILHTSGSTGAPKGVAISHRSSLAFVNMATDFFSVTAEDRLCAQAPLHFDLSVFDLFVACQTGAAVVLIPEFFAAFPKKMVSAIQTHGITVWNSVVSSLALMLKKGKIDDANLECLRLVIFSGEVMPIPTLRGLAQHMPAAQFYNVYGQTEANSSMYYRVDTKHLPRDDTHRLPIGRAFPGFEVYAVDEVGSKIGQPRVEGELLVESEAVADGYFGQPALTAERFRHDVTRLYRTGDRVFLNDEGQFVFAGRTDNMIKIRGCRVELGDVELCLAACDGVDTAAALALPDKDENYELIAFVAGPEGTRLDPQFVLDHCKARLPQYMVPTQLHVRSSFPRTSTGKIDRRALATEHQS